MEAETDLWGDPIPPRTEKRGRPEHVVTDEKRKRVKTLRAMNKGVAEIAAAMGIDRATVRKHYSPELRGGLDQLRAQVLTAVAEKACGGNVSAARLFFHLARESDLGRPIPTPRPTPAQRLGKKAQAAIDAREPQTGTTMGDLLAERAGLPGLH